MTQRVTPTSGEAIRAGEARPRFRDLPRGEHLSTPKACAAFIRSFRIRESDEATEDVWEEIAAYLDEIGEPAASSCSRETDTLSAADLSTMTEVIAAADEEIRALCNGKKWRMSIPAQPDHDSDLVISQALCVASELLKRLASRASAPTAAEDYQTKYYELLYAVGNKYAGESRHETALRYIRGAEAQTDGPASVLSSPSPAPTGEK